MLRIGTLPYRLAVGALLGMFALFAPAAPQAAETGGAATSGWLLLRSPNPQGGRDAISMSHTADTMRSDLDLAGMMLKCGEHGMEVVIVALTPLPPRARPAVVISARGQEWQFPATVVSPGAELLLPTDAARTTTGVWRSAHELSVKVTSPERSFAGVIPIDGIDAALSTLSAICPAG